LDLTTTAVVLNWVMLADDGGRVVCGTFLEDVAGAQQLCDGRTRMELHVDIA